LPQLAVTLAIINMKKRQGIGGREGKILKGKILSIKLVLASMPGSSQGEKIYYLSISFRVKRELNSNRIKFAVWLQNHLYT
jgi:hypothetical protein